MQSGCFAATTYAEGSSSDEDLLDEDGVPAMGSRVCHGFSESQKPYCPCGKPLRRVAKVPGHHVFLACSSSIDCMRCEEVILPGELHFVCRQCEDTKVCKDCGPGIYIEHTFDFFDPSTRERDVLEVPSRVLHWRKERQAKRDRQRDRGRGLSIAGGEEEDALALQLSLKILANAQSLVEEVMAEETDELDKDWGTNGMLQRLLGTVSTEQTCEAVHVLVSAAARIFASSGTLQDVSAPCKVFGDLHGQLRDLLLLFGTFGFPGTPECPSVIFNGDFVDRGKHQVEVLLLLYALKVAHPTIVFLNRGNHEDFQMNKKYGFYKSCIAALGTARGDELYDQIEKSFAVLPLASLVQDKILVVHGGIGDGNWSIDDLRKVKRPLSHADLQQDYNQWLWNLLWSDPIEDDESTTSYQVFGVHSSPRGKLAVKFGWNVTQAFCARNGLDLVIRSHQTKKNGLGFDVMHNESLIRVFSARDYEGHRNDCCVVAISDDAENEASSGSVLVVRPQVLSSISRG